MVMKVSAIDRLSTRDGGGFWAGLEMRQSIKKAIQSLETHIIIIACPRIAINNAKQSTADFAPLEPFAMEIIVNFHAIIALESLENAVRAIHIAAAIYVAIKLKRK
jgi:hypothetical protein